MQLGLH